MVSRITEEKTVKEPRSQHGCNGLIFPRNHLSVEEDGGLTIL